MSEAIKVSFAITSTADSLITIGSGASKLVTPGGTGIVITTLVANNPLFWIEKDTNGNDHLCTCKIDGLPLQADFSNPGGTYPLTAQNFEIVDFVGGRPVHRPHAY